MGLSRQTVVVVAVCASLGTLALAYLTTRLFIAVRHRAVRPTPLPPIQPLAHHRELQLAKLDDRTTWYTDLPPLPFASASPLASKTSLLGKDSRPTSTIPSHQTRYSPHPDIADDVDDLSPMSSQQRLALPNPPFHDLVPSSPSSSSSDNDLSYPHPTTPPSRSLSESHTAHPRPSRYSARPISISSSASTATPSVSRHPSRHTLRGMPHSPHNQVQIILPAPLASGLSFQQRPTSLRWDTDASDKTSVVDKWVPVGGDYTSGSTAFTPNLATGGHPNPDICAPGPYSNRLKPAPPSPRSSRRVSSTPPPVPLLPFVFTNAQVTDTFRIEQSEALDVRSGAGGMTPAKLRKTRSHRRVGDNRDRMH